MTVGILTKIVPVFWYLPILVLAVGSLGRGVFNLLLFLYFLLGLVFFFHSWKKGERIFSEKNQYLIFFIWLVLFLSYALSGWINEAVELGIKQWTVSLLSSMTLLFTLSIARIEKSMKTISWLGWGMVFFLLLYAYRLVDCILDTNCIPTESIAVTSVPILLPFMFLFVYLSIRNHSLGIMFILGVLFIYLVILADSRTEILMSLVLLVTMTIFHVRNWWILLLVPICLLLLIGNYHSALTFSAHKFQIESDATHNQAYNAAQAEVYDQQGITGVLAIHSNNRIAIWSRTIENPPANLLFGAGINNTMAYLPENDYGSALHNAYLEIWYETGFLGLGLWLLLFIVLLQRLFKAYRYAKGEHRMVYSTFLASFFAVLVAGMLDKGYMSIYFNFFIFYLGGMLYILGEQKVFDEFADDHT